MGTRSLAARRRFTADEFECMERAGILHEDDRVELIEGDIIEMAAVADPHVGAVNVLTRLFVRGVDDRAVVSVQNPVRLSSGTEPQPDLTILRLRADDYRTAKAAPGDVLLLIEVSDTTLAYDRDLKLRLYALAGVAEVWVFDLTRRRVFVYREPAGSAFRVTETITTGTVSPDAFPDVQIPLDTVFG